MKEHAINQLNNFIMGWYSDDTSFCDEMINIHKETPHKGEGIIGNRGVVKDVKESIDSAFYPDSLKWLKYGDVLQKCINAYVNKYNHANTNGNGLSVNEVFNVQHYPVSGGYKVWHSERNSYSEINLSRQLVFMTYLNDVEGPGFTGGTEFFYQNTKIRAEKGLTLIWPSDWMHTHKGIISNHSEKYIVTGWIHMKKSNQFNLI
jgi:hypothetical protein